MEKLEEKENKIIELENEKEVKKEESIITNKEVKVKDLVKGLENIFILGRGQSLGYAPTTKIENSEVWGCNNVYRARELDRLFIMHDIYMVQYLREKSLIEEINGKDFPVYTLGKYDVLKNNVRYPTEEILKEFEISYLINNASYMLALAILQKPKKIILFGVDMAYGTQNEYMYNEKACIEFWLGMAKGRDIDFIVSEQSTLMKRRGYGSFYGMKETVNAAFAIRLDPEYTWGSKTSKSAMRYKIIKAKHNL